jgi:hypothetical protein
MRTCVTRNHGDGVRTVGAVDDDRPAAGDAERLNMIKADGLIAADNETAFVGFRSGVVGDAAATGEDIEKVPGVDPTGSPPSMKVPTADGVTLNVSLPP